MSSRRRSWPCFLPLAVVLTSVLLFYLVAPNLYTPTRWKIDEASSEHSSSVTQQTTSTVTSDDLTIQLHPQDHESRPATTIRFEWNITKGERRPDGVAKDVFLINGQHPGQLIECRSGDELVITVNNDLDGYEGLAIHWHGVNTPNDMDGSSGLTQCPIRPGKSYTYRMKIDEHQSGTFWYHSHFETQRSDGLYGPLVIHKPSVSTPSDRQTYLYDHDQILMVGDWYHRPAVDVLDQYDSWKRYKVEPTPDSMVLNGKGFFDCSMAVPARPVDCKPLQLPHLALPSGRTRLRIVNTGSLTGFSLRLIGCGVTAIAVDGGNGVVAGPATREIGVLYPGERVDIVVDKLNPTGRITVVFDQENIRYANEALRSTQQFPISAVNDEANSVSSRSITRARALTSSIDLTAVKGKKIQDTAMPRRADKTFLLYATMTYMAINSNKPRGSINHTTWTVSERFTPLLALGRSAWPDPEPFVPSTKGAKWVDIVLNNFDDRGHPFHLHGHDFYVLARHEPSRTGEYVLWDPFDGQEPAGGPLNLVNPLKKDTVYVPSMGYVVLRFLANNPGLWLFHCHVLWHQSVGMGMAFEIGDSSSAGTWKHLQGSAHRSCVG